MKEPKPNPSNPRFCPNRNVDMLHVKNPPPFFVLSSWQHLSLYNQGPFKLYLMSSYWSFV